MRRKTRYQKRLHTSTQPHEFSAVAHPFNGIDREKLHQALTAHGRKQASVFPDKVDAILDTLRRVFPPQVIATLAAYGLQQGVSYHGVVARSETEKLQQHHVELLQALALALPAEEWGSAPARPTLSLLSTL